MAINNTSPSERTVRTDEFILNDTDLSFPESHMVKIKPLIEAGYSIETVSIMNETQSRVIGFNAIPTSVMFEGISLEQLEKIINIYLKDIKDLL